MKRYYELLTKKALVKYELHKERDRLHGRFMKLYARRIKRLDFLVIFIIVMNFGARAMTNAMVVKESPAVEILELNPVMAGREGLKEHPEARNVSSMIIRFLFDWAIMAGIYILARRYIYTEHQLFIVQLLIIYYLLILGYDFFNDYGYYVGKVVWGGL